MSTPDPSGWTLPKLRIDASGDWFDDDVQVTHPGIVANLRSSLRRDREGYFIQTHVRIPVSVEDKPFTVTRIERRGDQLIASVNDGTEETVDSRALRLEGDIPYCPVKGGAFDARLTRAAAYQLLAMAERDQVLRAQLAL